MAAVVRFRRALPDAAISPFADAILFADIDGAVTCRFFVFATSYAITLFLFFHADATFKPAIRLMRHMRYAREARRLYSLPRAESTAECWRSNVTFHYADVI